MTEKFPFVSVVVPTYNKCEYLKECLNAIFSMSYPKERLEIIVVDDASTDETPRILSGYQRKGVTVIRHDRNRGAAGARNSGIMRAQGDVVAFVDDDCTVNKNWLRELVKPYEDPEVAGVGGPVMGAGSIESLYARYSDARIWKQATFLANLQSKIFRWKPPESDGEIQFYAYHGTGNMSYRKNVLLEIGGFDERLVGGEDFSLKMEVAEKGCKTAYAKNAVAWHPRRQSFKDFLYKDCVRRGMGRAAFLIKYRWQIIRWLFSGRKIILFVPLAAALLTVVLVVTGVLELSGLLLVLLGGAILYELIEAARIAHYAKNLLLMPAFFMFDCLRKIMLTVGFMMGLIFLLKKREEIHRRGQKS